MAFVFSPPESMGPAPTVPAPGAGFTFTPAPAAPQTPVPAPISAPRPVTPTMTPAPGWQTEVPGSGFRPARPETDEEWFIRTRGRPPTLDEAGTLIFVRQLADPEGARAYADQRHLTAQTNRLVAFSQQGVGDYSRMLLQGITLGRSDELLAEVDALRAVLQGQDPEIAWQQRWQFENQAMAATRAAAPALSMIIEGAGGIVPALGAARIPAWAARTTPTNLPTRMAMGAAAGAAGAGGYAYNATFGNEAERQAAAGKAAAIGTGFGVAAAPVGQAVARGVSGATNVLRHPIAGVTAPGAGLNLAERLQLARQFNIPLTRGQATGNVTQQASEQRMINAAMGEPAQARMRSFINSQNEAIRDAGGALAAQFAGPLNRTFFRREAAEEVISGVTSFVRRNQAEAASHYAVAELLNPWLSKDSSEFFRAGVLSHIADGDFRIRPDSHPSAFAALDYIENFATMATGVNRSLMGIEALRRQLNKLTGTNPEDAAAVKVVRRAFDDAFNDIMDWELFMGPDGGLPDPAAIRSLFEGREVASRYLSITRPQSGDEVARFMNQIVDGNKTPEHVANWLYGSENWIVIATGDHVTSEVRLVPAGDPTAALILVSARLPERRRWQRHSETR